MHHQDVVPKFATRLRELRGALPKRELARRVPCSHVHISDLEKGEKRPSPKMAARLDSVLGAGGALEALASEQPIETRQSGGEAEELRQRLLRAATVDANTIHLLAAQADGIRQVDRRMGAQVATPQSRGHVATLEALRTFSVQPGQREQLARLYADASTLLGWQLLDLGVLEAAWTYHEAAKHAAREGGSPAALAHAMAEQAYILVELQEPKLALSLANQARVVAGTTVPPLLRSWLLAVCAELHSIVGDESTCQRGFDEAQDQLPAETSDPELPYVFLAPVHLDRWRGNALARLGDPAATEGLQRALDNLDPSFARARAGVYVDLAYALAAAKDHAGARVALREADLLTARVGSARHRQRARKLESALARRKQVEQPDQRARSDDLA